MKRVLVTGANGLVGRHVCRKLLEAGWRVRGTIRRESAKSTLPPGVEPFLTDSVESVFEWGPALDDCDAVVHLIARTHVTKEVGTDSLLKYRDINVNGTRELLNSCRDSSVRRFVYLSSIKAVGEGATSAYGETVACQPEDAYGISKREAEQMVLEMADKIQLEPVILRPSLVYGPGVGGNFLRLTRMVERGIPMPLARIHNPRSIVYVDNLADAICVSLTHPAAANEVLHVADQPPVSTRHLVELLAESLGQRARLFPFPVALLRLGGLLTRRSGEIDRLVGTLAVSTEKIERLLQWQPKITLEEGIHQTVAEYRIRHAA